MLARLLTCPTRAHENDTGEAISSRQRSKHLCLVYHTIDFPALFAKGDKQLASLQGMKDPLTEQWKSGPPIPLSFDEFEFVDLAFHLPVGIDQG